MAVLIQHQVSAYQLLAQRRALMLEVKTGLRHSRGSVMNAIKTQHGVKGNTKAEVLKNFEIYLDLLGIPFNP